ncbi:MAG TPA: T9SS type A sorting domain-containing protein, partial [Bacteroidota bacterium]|nr:T9SS type A sorting domain-containing protein [Bacteroidota bacterium]
EGVPQDIYMNMDSLVRTINSAFSKPLPFTVLDTLSWKQGTNFKLRGAVELQDVPFLIGVSNSSSALNAAASAKQINLPTAFELHQNYPNPFNPVTVLSFDLPVSAHVRLTIYNTLGQVVRILVDEDQDAGYKSASWNAANVASGLYFYRLEAVATGDPSKIFTEVKKMLLIK